jgi:hypothetical protein
MTRNLGWAGPAAVVNEGRIVMNDSSAIARNSGIHIGGVDNYRGAALTMNDSSSIHDNSVWQDDQGKGGGVCMGGGTFTMTGASSDHGAARQPGP